MKGLNEYLKQLRMEHGLTQSQAAAIIGITQTAYHRYEDGIGLIPLDNLKLLCNHYKLSLSEFFAGMESEIKGGEVAPNSGTSSEKAGQPVPDVAGTVPETEEETVKLFTIEIRANKQALQNLSLRIKED